MGNNIQAMECPQEPMQAEKMVKTVQHNNMVIDKG